MESGTHANVNDVVTAAVALFRHQFEKSEDLRREAAIGIEQAERGAFVAFAAEDVKAEGRRLLAARKVGPKRTAKKRRKR